MIRRREDQPHSPVDLPSLPAANFLHGATEKFLIKMNNSQGHSYPLLCQRLVITSVISILHLSSQASAKAWWLQPARQSKGEPAVIYQAQLRFLGSLLCRDGLLHLMAFGSYLTHRLMYHAGVKKLCVYNKKNSADSIARGGLINLPL